MSQKSINIILITVDSLRPDHLGCYGYSENTSPYIDNLASKGALFLQAISNGGGTPEAFPSILASVLPPLHHNEYNSKIRANTTIAEVLKKNNYATAAFHSLPHLSRSFGYHKGFDKFIDNLRIGGRLQQRQVLGSLMKPGKAGYILLEVFFNTLITAGLYEAGAEKVTRAAIPWLRKCTGKFFLWVHYMDVHSMTQIPKSRRKFGAPSVSYLKIRELHHKAKSNPKLLSEDELGLLISKYDSSIRYVDYWIGLLLEEVYKDRGDTVTILCADHGDTLGEHGRFGGHWTLHDEVIRVPLIISSLGSDKNTTVKEQVSLLDLGPTIVDLANIREVISFQGRSLLPLIKGQKQVSQGVISTSIDPPTKTRSISYRTKGWKYIYSGGYSGLETNITRELYDLRTDPRETCNLINKEIEKAREFESKISDFVSQSR